jgi:hypothetical protein
MPATNAKLERATREEENDQDAPPDSEDAEAEGGEPEAEEGEVVDLEPAQPCYSRGNRSPSIPARSPRAALSRCRCPDDLRRRQRENPKPAQYQAAGISDYNPLIEPSPTKAPT